MDAKTPTGVIHPGGFKLKFHWRVFGTPAPVFPGFEIDICDRVGDVEKPDAVWHRERARGMLRSHPEVRKLFGNDPWSAAWCIGFAVAQIAIAIAVSQAPWWGVVLAAYVVGSWINICLFNLAHECNHHLVFGSKKWDRILFSWTSLPMTFPGHHTWWIEHHVHHNDLGAKKDFVKRRRSILLQMKDRLMGIPIPEPLRPVLSWITTPLFWPIFVFMWGMQIMRSIVGLAVYAVTSVIRMDPRPSDLAMKILADEHLVSGYDRYRLRGWAVTYPIMCLGMLGGLFWFFGWPALVYMLLSALFMSGFLHPLNFGLILSNSHFHGHEEYQPTASYYGWLNWITFNFGLHTEHHDLEKIPWYRLGQLRRIAPEYYEPLKKTRSYAWLALLFAFGRRSRFDSEDYRNAAMLSEQPAASRRPPSRSSVGSAAS